ncbi:hypothetical protein SAMN05216167_103401 [Spirosoma endophyticum]|uniref:Uncharacterized protein n=1 Tax=Spirosoma endophyticum TaxID=662367 RepID=A0A1I1PZC7_9BACT|nr:hypothetical protein SAMN05216167_103401 [Spirosoma endophyticum]
MGNLSAKAFRFLPLVMHKTDVYLVLNSMGVPYTAKCQG